MQGSTSALYSEQQQFSPRLLAFILFSTGIAGIGAFAATRESSAAGLGLMIVLAAMAVLLIVFRTFNLTTTIESDGVRVKGMWFVDRLIRFEDIASAEMRVYQPLREYGGWGYRIGPAGKAYNAQGNEGLQLVLKDGGRVLIGSQRAAELASLVANELQRLGR